MTKVLIIISYLTGGGAEHVARKNVECLMNHSGYQVGVLTCDSETVKKYPVASYVVRDFKKETNIISRGISVLGIQENYSISLECLREFRPDIIHIHDFIPMTPSVLNAVYEYKKAYRCKVVMTHHTYFYICTNDTLYNYATNEPCEQCIGKLDTTIIKNKCSGNIATSCAKYLQKRRFASYWANLIDLHISPSEFLKQKLLQADSKLCVEVVYNPCIETILPASTEKKTDTIVYFGRISREKNIVNFAKIFAGVDTNYQLLIVGDGKLSDEMKEAASHAAKGKIRFINQFLDTDKLYKTISTAKYFVLPSVWYENSPVSIIEGINWSMIPLVSDLGGMKELVNLFGMGHMFNPRDGDEICSMIKGLKSDDEDQNVKLKKSRLFLNNFTAVAYSKRICEIYQRSTSQN